MGSTRGAKFGRSRPGRAGSGRLERPTAAVPADRIRRVGSGEVRPERRFVLYWMIAARRTRWSFALQHAVHRAHELDRPLVVLEALRAGHRWASERLHAFVLDGMRDNARSFAARGVLHHAYVEPADGAGRGLVEALARDACAVVTDDYPAFFLPRMIAAVGARLDVALEAVDSNGLVPMRLAGKAHPTAHAFRRFLQRELPAQLARVPQADPLAGVALRPMRELPMDVAQRWPAATAGLLGGGGLERLPIDHEVRPVARTGGPEAGERALSAFLERLGRYADERNQPQADATSGLSPYLHFGHLSAHEVLGRIARQEGWSPDCVAPVARGAREGWWGTSAPAEAFLDQLVTWRELAFNTCAFRPDHDRYESLPDWARRTLGEHEGDPREHVYDLAALEAARTHDPLWNAAQLELVREGRIHNYLRMLWGKKVLEWTRSPRDAFAILVELNNKYALDGRDPSSYAGISWVLGRYDRPWAPERPVFGRVRFMSSRNTARKVRVREYLARYAPGSAATRS